ncbi:GTP-binding protein [Desulfoplanes sp. PS50]
MKFITVAGPPSSGKTLVIIHLVKLLQTDGIRAVVGKIDCHETADGIIFKERLDIPVVVGRSDYVCPDHYGAVNAEEIFRFGRDHDADITIVETAGLCHRCAPAIKGCLAIAVVDNISGIDTPRKIGPMLTTADVVVITKGDMVSQAEREVFRVNVLEVNPTAKAVEMNGLTGMGSLNLKRLVLDAPETDTLTGRELRHDMPSAVCSYCEGETRIGSDFQMGNVIKMDVREVLDAD